MRVGPTDREHCLDCGQAVTQDPNIGVVYHAQTGGTECPSGHCHNAWCAKPRGHDGACSAYGGGSTDG